jgi:putative hemolysin
MFGCASLPGIDPDALSVPLSYLYYYYLAPPALRAVAVPSRHIEMRRTAQDLIDPAAAMLQVPPLLKAYLRIGGFIGDGAVIDHQFQTTDVCIIVKTELITGKYARHYQPMARENPATANGVEASSGIDE